MVKKALRLGNSYWLGPKPNDWASINPKLPFAGSDLLRGTTI